MASWGGHTLPGFFFLLFGLYEAFRISLQHFRKPLAPSSGGRRRCCFPCTEKTGIGVVKIMFTTIGIMIELFYPGAPMGRLHDPNTGSFINPANWQHATMYYFFLVWGVADILSVVASEVVPQNIEKLFGALALFIEGYLFYFHLHGRSNIDTRVHVLIVMTVWPCAAAYFAEFFITNNKTVMHKLQLLHTTLMLGQGFWFWQVAYILYPPGGVSWDPCMQHEGHRRRRDMGSMHDSDDGDCNNGTSMLNNMFLTMFYSWWIATSIAVVTFIYFAVYQYCKARGVLVQQHDGVDVHYDVTNYRKVNGFQSQISNSSALLIADDDFEQDDEDL